jgi:hypothetical protein
MQAALREAIAAGVLERCGKGWYQYVEDTPTSPNSESRP